MPRRRPIEPTKNCPRCQEPAWPEARFCGKCGYTYFAPAEPTQIVAPPRPDDEHPVARLLRTGHRWPLYLVGACVLVMLLIGLSNALQGGGATVLRVHRSDLRAPDVLTGRDRIRCPLCRGTGQIDGSVQCPRCHGFGIATVDPGVRLLVIPDDDRTGSG